MEGNGNGHKVKEEIRPKLCPFLKTRRAGLRGFFSHEYLNKECIGEKCVLFSELMQNTAGFQKRFGVCAFNAVVLILSEINQKAAKNEQQKIQIPNIFRKG